MSKYQTLTDALAAEGLSDFPWMAFGPSNDAAPPDYYDEVVAVRSDAQVQVICRAPRDRDDACTADMTYIAEANPATVRALLADLEVAEKAQAVVSHLLPLIFDCAQNKQHESVLALVTQMSTELAQMAGGG